MIKANTANIVKRTWTRTQISNESNLTIDIWDSGSHLYERWPDGDICWKVISREFTEGCFSELLQKMPEWFSPGQVLHWEQVPLVLQGPSEYQLGQWNVVAGPQKQEQIPQGKLQKKQPENEERQPSQLQLQLEKQQQSQLQRHLQKPHQLQRQQQNQKPLQLPLMPHLQNQIPSRKQRQMQSQDQILPHQPMQPDFLEENCEKMPEKEGMKQELQRQIVAKVRVNQQPKVPPKVQLQPKVQPKVQVISALKKQGLQQRINQQG